MKPMKQSACFCIKEEDQIEDGYSSTQIMRGSQAFISFTINRFARRASSTVKLSIQQRSAIRTVKTGLILAIKILSKFAFTALSCNIVEKLVLLAFLIVSACEYFDLFSFVDGWFRCSYLGVILRCGVCCGSCIFCRCRCSYISIALACLIGRRLCLVGCLICLVGSRLGLVGSGRWSSDFSIIFGGIGGCCVGCVILLGCVCLSLVDGGCGSCDFCIIWLGGVRLSDIWFGSIGLSSICFCGIGLSVVWFCCIWLCDIRLCCIWLSSIWLCCIRLSCIWLCDIRLCCVRLSSIWLCIIGFCLVGSRSSDFSIVWLCCVGFCHIFWNAVFLLT